MAACGTSVKGLRLKLGGRSYLYPPSCREGVCSRKPRGSGVANQKERAGVSSKGSPDPFASLQEPGVLSKQETITSSVSNKRRAPHILFWGTSCVNQARS